VLLIFANNYLDKVYRQRRLFVNDLYVPASIFVWMDNTNFSFHASHILQIHLFLLIKFEIFQYLEGIPFFPY